jgi:histidinol dehydrogenase
MGIKLLNYRDAGFRAELEAFLAARNDNPQLRDTVAGILADVRQRGDAAVIDYTRRFDGFASSPQELRIEPAALRAAARALSAGDRAAIDEAQASVEAFHRRGLPRDWMARNPHGARVGERWYPLGRVGIYIPAGNVPLVSTVIMTVTLARLAGVPSIAVCTPAGKDGRISPAMLGALARAGVTEVYRIGGAQAIAALAYGTATIPAVDKIMGPGNSYVAEAQRQVFGTVGIDLLPGPSEEAIIADETADPQWVAADLLAQAEHGSGKEKIFLIHLQKGAGPREKAIIAAMEQQLQTLRHATAIRRVLDTGTLFIRVPTLKAAIQVTNTIAPEHLELHVAYAVLPQLVDGIRTAGVILCGHHTPTVLGDFAAGPSHTLPTNRTGRFFSGLKITDFMRRSSIIHYDAKSLRRARGVVDAFATMEQLDAHGASLTLRLT